MQRYGPTGVVLFTWDFESVAALDAAIQRINEDQAFNAMQRKNSENFIEGSFVDQVLVMRH